MFDTGLQQPSDSYGYTDGQASVTMKINNIVDLDNLEF